MLDLTVEENTGDGSKIMQLTAMDADEVVQTLSLNFWNLVFQWSNKFLLYVDNICFLITKVKRCVLFSKEIK